MLDILNKIFGKVFGKQRKFFPVLNKHGVAQKPRKFLPITEREYLLEQRRRGVFGNGLCCPEDF